MSEDIEFVCTKCGGQTFRTSVDAKTFEDFIGAPCATCGTPLTEDDIRTQALKIAEDAARKAFGDDGEIKINIDV